MPDARDRLDIAAGDESVATAVELEKESRAGVSWVGQALGFVRGEIQRDANIPATLMPSYEKDMLLSPGDPPDYAEAGERAASEAGVRVGTR